ncbi:MAG: diguanylate cyclase, partial [Candidatus Omnitrophica bacterium]|nr:diguanylate cyclase [Candidatus Omnitrophota bacterium]
MFVALDVEGRVTLVNKKVCAVTGRSEKELLGQSWFESVVPARLRADVLTGFSSLISGEIPGAEYFENPVVAKNGEERLIAWHNIILRDETGKIVGTLSAGEDITERKQVEAALRTNEEMIAQERNLLRTLIDNMPDSIYVKDLEGRKILVNKADLEFIGIDSDQKVLGKTDADVYPLPLAEQFARDDRVVLNGRPIINREEFIESVSGQKRWLLTSKLPLKDLQGKLIGLVGIGRDITERKNLEGKLLTMAHYDTLTALPNRSLFLEKANTGIFQARRSGKQCAIIFIDLDHFKAINDTLGHSVGDELLKDTAVRLADCIRESDTIARLGGDEFTVFLPDLEDAQLAQQVADRIRDKFNTPRLISGNDLFITGSMGIAVYPTDGETLEDLLKNADTAMYVAKEAGRNTYCFFNHVMNQKAVTKMQVERGLREALNRNEFRLFYQPIIRITDKKIRGFEALIRWFRTEGGLVFPNEFIPVAEETGLIIPMGEWVLRQACRFNKSLLDAGFGNLIMSVN